MIIKVERSGGLAGIPVLNEVDSKDLPSELKLTAKKIMTTRKTSFQMKAPPKGAGDYYSYKISIQEGDNRNVVECNDFTIEEDLKMLVKYIQRNSKTKKNKIP